MTDPMFPVVRLALCVAIIAGSYTHAGAQDAASATPASVTVDGVVAQKLTLGATELAALAHEHVDVVDDDKSKAAYDGVELHLLLERAGVTLGEAVRGARLLDYVVVTATDGYRAVFALAELDPAFADRKIILADRRNGIALDAKHGPLRIVVPDESRHARWVRQVASITIAHAPPPGNAAPGPTADISPPPGVTAVSDVQAGGVQIYVCRATPSGPYAWTLRGPKALLLNADGSDFGTHSAGPTWTALDGSSIVADGANPLAKIQRPDAVPALLLAVKTASGNGVLSGIRFVRRAGTEGGLPPMAGCDSAHQDATVASHYSAVYTFYR